ncbi:DUF4236 domain-containing protein [Pluralibacter gergoviae]|uniref:DUF4236 domain-containing protein n=1 Tax=Pluralibacter gergoviae TaxID=61647 RepID=UPI003EE30BB7
MGFRFRKRIRIAPGLAINISKSGVSTSIGTKGATTNISGKGIKTTVGIPGTGISYSVGPGGKKGRKAAMPEVQEQDEPVQKEGINWWRLIFFIIAAFVLARIFKQ